MDYAQIYRQYYGKISRYLAGIVGQSEAEDIAQEVFIKVGTSLDNLRDPSKLSTWIFEIALNTAKDRLRYNSTVKSGRDRLTPLPDSEDQSGEMRDTKSRTPEENLEYSSMIECYLAFVKGLPKAHYEVYILSELEELSGKEISKMLSLPLETVKMRLHRARARLYKDLRTHCRCYRNERGELMGDLKSKRSPKSFKA